MPRLSILIPCLGGSTEFDGTLVSVLQHRPSKCEVIVAHTAAYDDPYNLADEVEFLHCPDESSLVGLINAATDAATSPIIHVLACGLLASEGWTDAILPHFADDEVAAVVPAVMNADGSQLVSAGVHFTAAGNRAVLRNQRLLLGGSGHLRAAIGAPTLAAGFYRRDVLAALDGMNQAAGDQLADVDFALSLRELELRTEFEPAARLTQIADPLAFAGGDFSRGRIAEKLFWLHADHVGLPLGLALHSLAVVFDPAALLGRLVAMLEIGSTARHRRRVAAAAARLAEIRAEERETLPLPAAQAPIRLAA
ncbi:MAG: hypothetical protein L0211_07520 [Planctomycetaceae bacterium]|nr:hypothetical protein [Planctomycetaceae bacterium]